MKKKLLIILLIVVMLELTLFNVNSYRVLSSNSKIEYAKENLEAINTAEDEIYIEIDNINTEVKTIHLELNTLENVDYQVFYTDATSSKLKDLPKKKYIMTSE